MSYLTRALLVLFMTQVALSATAGTPEFPPWGVTLSYMDSSVSPGVDFFRYTNGAWLKTATIPPDRRIAGVNLELQRRNEADLKSIVASLSKRSDAQLSTEERKLRDLYNAFENTQQIEAAGLAPVKADLARIAALKTPEEVATFMGAPATQVAGPYDIDIDVDEKNPDAYVVQLRQSGLGMPDRDYYLRRTRIASPPPRGLQELHRRHARARRRARRAARRGGVRARGARSRTRTGRRDERARRRQDLQPDDRSANSSEFRAGVLRGSRSLQPPGVPLTLAARRAHRDRARSPRSRSSPTLFAATPVAVWRDYLTVRYLHAIASYLPDASINATSPSTARLIGGQKQQLPRDMRAHQSARRRPGRSARQALCRDNTSRRKPRPRSKQLVANLLKAYEADIRTLGWMTPATRAEGAGEARDHFTPKIGYPDNWRDYSALDDRRAATCSATSAARDDVRVEPRARAARRAGRPQRVGHDAADHQRLLQPAR